MERHLFRCGDFGAKRQCLGKLSQIGGVDSKLVGLDPVVGVVFARHCGDFGKITWR